ncbi:MAG: acyl carrier protein [Gaiellales bacterium]
MTNDTVGNETETISGEVRHFLTDNFPLSAGFAYSSSDSLIGVGAIDSTGVLELIEFLEERYEIRISDDEVLPENLDSIDAIVRFVTEKRAA